MSWLSKGNSAMKKQSLKSSLHGFSMVEVMITLLVVSVALLSSVSLQVLSKRSNYDAAQRTTAAHLAEDLLERMRNNPTALIDYITAGNLGNGSRGGLPATNCGDPLIECTAAELATFDMWHWEQLLDGSFEVSGGESVGGLVTPTACINGPGFGGNGVYSIAIAWRGMTELTNPVIDNCGAGSGNYGANDVNRRIMVVRTFVNAS
jgi:type IV pilus assembly protein PilV